MFDYFSEYILDLNLNKLIPAMLKSTGVTLQVFILVLLFSIPLALVIYFGRMSRIRIVSDVTKFFLLVIRGTPLMLQLIFVYFAPQMIFEIGFDRWTAGIIAMVLNYAAYFAEIYRGGIQSIPQGQYEACKVLGFTKNQTFIRVVMPQVIKKIIPPMGNEVITLVKDTALIQVLGVAELFHVAKTQSGALVSVLPLFIAGFFYFIMNWAVSKTFDWTEKKLGYYK